MLILWIRVYMDKHIQNLSKPGEAAGDSMGKTGWVVGECLFGDPFVEVEVGTARVERKQRINRDIFVTM